MARALSSRPVRAGAAALAVALVVLLAAHRLAPSAGTSENAPPSFGGTTPTATQPGAAEPPALLAGSATPTPTASPVDASTSAPTGSPTASPASGPSAVPVGTPAPERPRELTAILDSAAAGYQGRLGVVVKHLGTGEMASLNAQQTFRSASLYKLFVLYSAYLRLESGELSRDELLTFSQEAYDAEPYAEWQAGTRTSVSCALRAMITLSNNAASEMLLERVGGGARVTADIRALGLEQSQIGGGYASTSPADVALLLEKIARRQLVSPEASDEMLGLLSDQRRNDRLPLPLPLGVAVAHKTGELTKLRNDAGIVFAPSGPYLFVALASDAPNDAAARQVILDLSRDVYAHFEPGGLAEYAGLPPRLAMEVLQVPDSSGRLAPLDDQWSETVSLKRAGVALVEGVADATLREMVVPDLLAMQRAAGGAGADFWVAAGFAAPRSADGPKVLNDGLALPCQVLPPPPKTPTPTRTAPARPTATPGTTPTPVKRPFTMELPPAPAAAQQWLGTVVAVSDTPDGEPTGLDYASSATGQWLQAHFWEYGFVEAPAESPNGQELGYEPWKLRWVGRELAAKLHALGYERDPTSVVTAELRRAEAELAAQAAGHRSR